MATVKVTLIKSMTGRIPNHKLCVKGLGLRRIGHTVEVLDTPENRGKRKSIEMQLKTPLKIG
jgi:ribosomal protein L30